MHGDIFSNSRLCKFGLRDNAACTNCGEQLETIQHRLIDCPQARVTWEKLENIKQRFSLNTLTDLTAENLVGVKDDVSKLELALQAELLLKIISESEKYTPERLVKSSLKVISYCERLEPEVYGKIKAELEI